MISVTPNRMTRLRLEGPHWIVHRHPWRYHRTAAQIAPMDLRIGGQQTQTGLTGNVLRVDGPAWIMAPMGGELLNMAREGWEGASFASVHTPGNFHEVKLYRPPDDLPGMGVTGAIGTPPPGYRKGVPHTGGVAGDWGAGGPNTLARQQTALPAPPLTQNMIPMDRVLSADDPDLSPNQGLILMFGTDYAHWFGAGDALARVYFGGSVPTDPTAAENNEAQGAGLWCLSLRGSGKAHLYEAADPAEDGTLKWAYRSSMQWRPNEQATRGFTHVVWIVPYGRESLLVISRTLGGDFAGGAMKLLGALADLISGSYGVRGHAFYQETRAIAGFEHTVYMTGHGTAQLDLRRDIRTPFGLYRIKYPETGTLTDATFLTDGILPAGTPLTLSLEQWENPLEAKVEGAIYDAATNEILDQDDDSGDWLTNEGQREYYVKLTFTPSADRYVSPVLYGYSVFGEGLRTIRQPAPILGPVQGVSITGPDITPEQETCSLKLIDPGDVFSILRTRGRIFAQVEIWDAQTEKILSIIFQGETSTLAAPRARKWGRKRRAGGAARGKLVKYPSPAACSYEPLILVGMFSRLADGIVYNLVNFAENAPDLITPEKPTNNEPWRLVDIIRYFLHEAGIDDAEMAIPDHDLRLLGSPKIRPDSYIPLPGTYCGQQLHYFTRSFMDWILLRDPNAIRNGATTEAGYTGPMGLWRIIFPTQPPYINILAEFHSVADLGEEDPNNPGWRGPVPEAPGAFTYVANFPTAVQTFIEDGSLEFRIDPPEVTEVEVYGGAIAGVGFGGNVTLQRHENRLRNFKAFDFDPNNPTADPADRSYLGRRVRVLIVDAMLIDQVSVDFVTRRVFRMAAFGRPYATFRAPLVLVRDRNDPHQYLLRPPRIYDEIALSLGGGFGSAQLALVRSCNPDYQEGDRCQMALYEVFFVTQELPQGSSLV